MSRTFCVAIAIVPLLCACGQPPALTAATGTAPAPAAASVAVTHPLDPLTTDEIRVAVQVARAEPRLANASFPSIAVHEPAKASVLAWQPGQPIVRHARVQAMTGDRTYELVVDLTGRRVVSSAEHTGVEPSITLSEIEATKVVLSHPEFKAGLQKRGVTHLSKVF